MKKMVLLLAALVMVSSNGFSTEMKHEMKAHAGKKCLLVFKLYQQIKQ